MTEERIVETRSPEGTTHTHTTVITDGRAERRGGGATITILLAILAVVVIAAIWAFGSMGGAEVAKDNAVANAADEVGAAASEVGDAAQGAASSVTH